MAKIKSSWWRPQSLAELGRLSGDDIRRQEQAYIAWLQDEFGCDEEDALNIIQVQRDEMATVEAEVTPEHSPSRVREERRLNEHVSIRTVKVYHTRLQWEVRPYWWTHDCPLFEPSEDSGPVEPGWKRLPKPDAPTTYEVTVDGQRRDGFLTVSRARQFAERLIANECSV